MLYFQEEPIEKIQSEIQPEKQSSKDDFKEDSIANHLFLKALISFLSKSYYAHKVLKAIPFNHFCSGEVPLAYLINKIIVYKTPFEDQDFQDAKDAASSFDIDKAPIDVIDALLHPYIKRIEPVVELKFGRTILKICGENLVISECLNAIEKLILTRQNSDQRIEEVHFAARFIHFDQSLGHDIWHEINLSVICNTLIIHDEIIWDVSGRDTDYTYETDAGADASGNGYVPFIAKKFQYINTS